MTAPDVDGLAVIAHDWADPGHDLPKPKHYRNLDAFLDSDGTVRVGNRAIEVVPADAYRGAVSNVRRLRAAIQQHRRAVLAGGEPPNFVDESLWVTLDQPGGQS